MLASAPVPWAESFVARCPIQLGKDADFSLRRELEANFRNSQYFAKKNSCQLSGGNFQP